MSEPDRRDEFLFRMYEQLMADINRHITVVWQSIATLAGSVAIFSLVKDQVLALDIATSLIIIVCFWQLAHVYDASAWYNRNLVIIANIERQFLKESDLRDIQNYFGVHRKAGKMISHLRYQYYFGWSVLILFLMYHIYQVAPKIHQLCDIMLINVLPWAITIAGTTLLVCIARRDRKDYETFVQNSPGKTVDVSGIDYSRGHGQ